jgi:AraC family transcriptional regulator of arabinose operon
MKRCNPYDPKSIQAIHYPNLVVGHYRMSQTYHIRRPAGTHDWLLVFTLAGAGRIRHADKERLVKPGDLYAFMPQTPHDYGTDPKTGHWELLWVHFQPPAHWLPLLDWPSAETGLHLKKLSSKSPAAKRVVSLFHDLYQSSVSSNPLRDWLAMNQLEALLLHCHAVTRSGQTPLDPRLKDLQEYIHRNLTADLSLAQLAKECRLSVIHLCTLFRRQLQTTPQKYIENYRITMAKRLLSFPSRSVKEVAYDVGYKDPLYFSRRFRAHTGLSPEHYRSS